MGESASAIHFTCSACKNPVGAPRAAAGKIGKCPKCGARVAVPEAGGAQLAHSLQTAPVPAVEEQQPVAVSAAPVAQPSRPSSARPFPWLGLLAFVGAVGAGVACLVAWMLVASWREATQPQPAPASSSSAAPRDYAREARRQMELERVQFYVEAEEGFERVQALRGDSAAYWINRRADELLSAKRQAAPQDEEWMYRRWVYESRTEAEAEWRRIKDAQEAADLDESRPKRSGRF
jgi:ribosomal protein L37AE/L43A